MQLVENVWSELEIVSVWVDSARQCERQWRRGGAAERFEDCGRQFAPGLGEWGAVTAWLLAVRMHEGVLPQASESDAGGGAWWVWGFVRRWWLVSHHG